MYDADALEPVAARGDALGNLARVFQRMAREVHTREQRLRRQLRQAQLDLEERQQAAAETPAVFLAMDRRVALARRESLPEVTAGAALFVDVSGFTALSEALASELGLQRGAEELIRQLNRVFATLIDEVHLFRGSAVSFAGDAMTAWFDGDDGLRAAACAVAMQQAMNQVATGSTAVVQPIALSVKVAVAAGPVHRLLVGDPDLQLIDTLAGPTIDALAIGERLAGHGEVVVQAVIAEIAEERLTVTGWRVDSATGQRFAVVADAIAGDVDPWPELTPGAPGDDLARPYLLPVVLERVRDGKSEFLAELRPAAALFLGFGGLDFERDDRAGERLDRFVRWVQGIVAGHDGSLLQVTTGDKGSYLYAAFGAPIAHEDDAVRAVAAALELLSPPAACQEITGIRIAVTYGQMRAGAYGGPTRRTYGVQGARTNLAAHLMQLIQEGIVCDEAIYLGARMRMAFDELPPVPGKGGAQSVPVYRPRPSQGHGRVSSLLDQLPPAAQLTLKVASVIGATFTSQQLRDIHPIAADRPNTDAHLAVAEAAGLVWCRAEPEPAWEFADSLCRDEAYRLLLFAQRRHLHRAVAEWYEQKHAGNLARFLPVLAHHWEAADDLAKAGHYFELAGIDAQRQGATIAAARYFRASLNLAGQATAE
jgi:class 3 adenylate cyclase